jgi:hypothetical protein
MFGTICGGRLDVGEPDAGQHERVLHVDDDQRGSRGIEVSENVLCAALLDDPVCDPLRNVNVVHRDYSAWP